MTLPRHFPSMWTAIHRERSPLPQRVPPRKVALSMTRREGRYSGKRITRPSPMNLYTETRAYMVTLMAVNSRLTGNRRHGFRKYRKLKSCFE